MAVNFVPVLVLLVLAKGRRFLKASAAAVEVPALSPPNEESGV